VNKDIRLTRRRTSFLLIAGAAMSVAGVNRLADAEGSVSAAQATQFVRQSGDRLVAILIGPGDPPEKRRQLCALIMERVDVPGIARFALGRFWNAASDKQRDEYVRLLPALLLTAVGGDLGEYRNMSFTIDRSSQVDVWVQVWTTLLLPGVPPRHVGWTVGATGNAVKIVDIVAEGISLRITQRDDCGRFLAHNNHNMDDLIAVMRRQANITS
jgi:phospholipid transport system substrate-binding protein